MKPPGATATCTLQSRREEVLALAERVFGDPDKAVRWLTRRKRRFGGKAPIELLLTGVGVDLVEEAILQFEHDITA
jgi:uncharacterized protein (DUF2384 family)